MSDFAINGTPEQAAIKEQVLESLAPLFERAEREGLWFRSLYQDVWLSPAELRGYLDKDQFVWGAVNWELRNPMELLANTERQFAAIQAEREQLKQRMGPGK